MAKDEEGNSCRVIFWVPVEVDGLAYDLWEIKAEVPGLNGTHCAQRCVRYVIGGCSRTMPAPTGLVQ